MKTVSNNPRPVPELRAVALGRAEAGQKRSVVTLEGMQRSRVVMQGTANRNPKRFVATALCSGISEIGNVINTLPNRPTCWPERRPWASNAPLKRAADFRSRLMHVRKWPNTSRLRLKSAPRL